MRKWASNSEELNELINTEETTLLSGKPAVEPTKSVETENIDQRKLFDSLRKQPTFCNPFPDTTFFFCVLFLERWMS